MVHGTLFDFSEDCKWLKAKVNTRSEQTYKREWKRRFFFVGTSVAIMLQFLFLQFLLVIIFTVNSTEMNSEGVKK